MYTLFVKTKSMDNSPFMIRGTSHYISQYRDYLYRLKEDHLQVPGYVKSDHILVSLIRAIDVPFNGSVPEMINSVEQKSRNILRSLSITNHLFAGNAFTNGQFYPGTTEFIASSKNQKHSWYDLWTNWKNTSTVEVLKHQITSLDIFVPGLTTTNKVSGDHLDDTTIINIDVGMFYCQWLLFKVANPDKSEEDFIKTIVLPNMLPSHIDQVFMNRLMMGLDLMGPCTVKTNVNMLHSTHEGQVDRTINMVTMNLLSRPMTVNQQMSTIYQPFSHNLLDGHRELNLVPGSQVMWLLLLNKMKRANIALKVFETMGDGKIENFRNVLNRTNIRVVTERFFESGLTNSVSKKLYELFDHYVTDYI